MPLFTNNGLYTGPLRGYFFRMTNLFDANLLVKAFKRAVQSSKWKTSSQKASHHRIGLLSKLRQDIMNGVYKTQGMTKFIISERGKTRLINGNTIRDRTLRHVLCDEILIPAIEKLVIRDNYASQEGKGVHFARNRLKEHLHKFYRHFGNQGYILIIDFSKYYDNILHDIAFEQLSEFMENDDQRKILENIFDSFKVDVSYMTDDEYENCEKDLFNSLDYQNVPESAKTGEKFMRKSIPIGDQTSQIIGIYYPHRLDNYCKIVKGLKYYGRYMDDLYVIHQDKAYLHQIYEEITEYAAQLGLHINHKKSQIYRIDRPFHFLQNMYYLTDSGRVVEKINTKRLSAMRRKLKKLAVMVENGERDKEDIVNMYRSWMGSHRKVMSRQQIENMESLYEELFGKE